MPKKQRKAAAPMAIHGAPEEHRVKGRRIGDMSIKDIVAMREAPGVTAFDQQMLHAASMNRLLGQVSDRLCLPPDLISELVFGGGADDEDELEEVDVLASITYLWCTQQGLILLFSSAKGFLTTFEGVQAVLLVASAVCARSTSRWYTGCAVLNVYEGGDSCPFEKTCSRWIGGTRRRSRTHTKSLSLSRSLALSLSLSLFLPGWRMLTRFEHARCYSVPQIGALSTRIAANTLIFPMLWESHLWCV
jgi:hypothetical protein